VPERRRRLKRAALASAALLALVAVVVHLPTSSTLVLDRVARWLRASAGLELSASRLGYNLFTLSVELDDVRLASAATPDDPFMSAARVEADFGWQTLFGRLELRRVVLESPSLTVRREPDGSGNLPDTATSPASPGQAPATSAPTLPPISIDDLDLDVTMPGFALRVQGAAADLGSPSAGLIALDLRASSGVSVTTGETTVAVDSVATRAQFDGRTVSIADFAATRPGTAVRATGSVDVTGDDPQLEIEFGGSTDLTSWADQLPDDGGLAGQIEGRGRVSGSRSNPIVTAELAGEGVGWSTVEVGTVRVSGTLQDGVLDIDTLTATVARGSVSGQASIALTDADRTSSAQARWSDVNVRELLADGFKPDVATSGTATVEWRQAADLAAGMQATVSAEARLVAGDEDARLLVRASSRAQAWHLEVETPRGDPDDVRAAADLDLDEATWTDSAINGTVTLTTPDAQRVLRRLEALGVPFGGFDVSTVSGTAAAAATLGGTLGALEIAGDLDAQAVVVAGSPQGELTTTVAFDLGAGTWNGTYEIALADIAPWVDARQPGLAIRGGLRAAGGWSGVLADPEATVQISGSGVSIAGVDLAELTAIGRASLRTIEVSQATVRDNSGGTLSLTGSVDPSTGYLSLTTNASGLGATFPVRPDDEEPAAVFAGASLTAVVEGTIEELNGRATLAIGSVRVGAQDLGAADAGVTFTNGSATVFARVPELSTSLEATVDLAAPYSFGGRGEMDGPALATLLATAGITLSRDEDLTGSVTATVAFNGNLDDLSTVSATLAVVPVDVAVFGVPVQAAADLRATVGEGTVRIERATLLVGDMSIGLAASLQIDTADAELAVSLDGELDSLAEWLSRFDSANEWMIDGRVTGHLDARRSAVGWSVTGSVEPVVASAHRAGELVAENLRAVLDADGARLHLAQLTGSVFSGETTVTASAPLSWVNEWLPAQLQMVASGPEARGTLEGTMTFDVAAAFNRAGVSLQQELTGLLTIRMQVEADAPSLEALTGDITIERGEMVTLNRAFAQFQPTVLRLADRRLTIESFDWRGASGDVTASGVIGLSADVDTLVNLVFDTNLRLVDTFLPGRATGVVRGTLDISGRPGSWSVVTEATLERANWLLPDYRLLLADWSGRFQLSTDAIVVSTLEGQLNGGTVTVSGRLPLGPGIEGGGLTIVAREVLLDIPRGLHSQAVADLRWMPLGDASVLGGTITVTANRYREPVTQMLEMVDALASSSRDSAESGALPEWLASTAFDIALNVTDPVILDNSLGTVEFVPELRLTGTLRNPALDGEIGVLDDGRINIGGRTYRLRESRLRFVPSEGLSPTLDVLGETRVGDYDVVLRITGTPDRIETTASSSPPLSERDLRSLLVTGQVESGASTSDDFALAAASTDILGFAGKFVGLDSVRLGAADLDIVSKDAKTAQHLTVSKSFGRLFELILSENLEDGPLTWVLVWKPVTGYEFRFASVENTQSSIEFRQELLFGPGTSRIRSAGRRATAGAPQPIVADIEITGSPGFGEDELRSVLRLKPGQRFDIRKWIDDRLRIEKFYRSRSYHRARIVPTRVEREPVGGVRRLTLRYDLERGPRTVIEVVGDDLPGAAIDEMHEDWGGVPIADVLREEFERIAKLELARRGYLQAAVSAEFVTVTDDLEQAVMTVDRGSRTRTQEIAWSGNRTMTAAELDAVVADLPAELSPFVDTSALIADLGRAYAERGFFSIETRIGRPVFERDRARLPIEIVEGTQARVTTLTLGGVAAERTDAARTAVGMPEGTVFGSRTAVEAHRRLEGFYADLGFRDAKVTYAIDRSPDGPVSIAMTVVEGLPHVISDVSVSGVESTSPALVDRAVTLAPGQQAGRQRALDTRRNLYDIGTFRQADVTFEPSPLAEPGVTIPVLASIVVEEPKKYQLRYGVQVSSTYTPAAGFGKTALGGTVELRDRNFLGRAMQASIGARYDTDIQTVSLLLSVPRTFGGPLRTSIYARERWETTEGEFITLQDRRREITFEQRWRARPTIEIAWSYALGYRVFRFSITGGDEVAEDRGYLAGPSVSVVFDRRDNPFDAKNGWFHSSSYQLGVEWLGSSLGYGRYLGRQSAYVSFGPMTLAGSSRWGTLDAYSGVPPLSVYDLLFTAGGTNTVRGYPEGSLSAIPLETLDFGGPELLVLNGEVRYPVWRWFRGVVFLDAGNTFLGWSDISLSKLALGGGLGIRINTPLAPLRFDFAYPLTTSYGYRGLRIHFSIGQMF
jgi:outer membrane protein assembly factor BamA